MEGVVVAARCRITSNEENCISIDDAKKQIVVSGDKSGDRIFHLNHVYNNSSQKEIFSGLVEPVISKTFCGFNGTIMAYGQTGSGKTYTMGMTSQTSSENQGIIYRALQSIFTQARNADVELSFLEVYKEEIFDLLSERREKLQVVDFQAQGLFKCPVKNIIDACSVLEKGILNRHVGATNANVRSSRSHAIFTIYITQKLSMGISTSKLHLIDLAGSESATKVSGECRREGIMINQGLLQLSNVMAALSASGPEHIPYRNSALTSILKDSLSAKNFVVLIACISPCLADISESTSTLKFAIRVCKLKCNPEAGFVVRQKTLITPFKAPRTPMRKNITIATPSQSIRRPALRHINNTIDSPRNLKNSNKWSAVQHVPPSSTPLSLNISRVPFPSITPLPRMIRSTVPECSVVDSDPEWNGLNISSSTMVDDSSLQVNTHVQSERMTRNSPHMSCLNGCSFHEDLFRTMVADIVRQDRNLIAEMVREELKAQILTEIKTNQSQVDSDGSNSLRRRSTRLSIARQNAPSFVRGSNTTVMTELDGPSAEQVNRFSVTKTSRTLFQDDEADDHASPVKLQLTSRLSAAKQRKPSFTGDVTTSIMNELDGPTPAKLRRSNRLSIKRSFYFAGDSDTTVINNPVIDKVSSAHNVEGTLCSSGNTSEAFTSVFSGKPCRPCSVRLSVLPHNDSSVLNSGLPKTRKSIRQSTRLSVMSMAAVKAKKSQHNNVILNMLQNGNLKQLQSLPTVGPKTAVIITNSRLIYGPLKSLSDLKQIKGLSKNFAQRFYWANNVDEDETPK